MIPSLWTETAGLPEFPPLDGDRDTDVLVIGGGIAGILCAHMLARSGADCLLLEADRLCGRVTGGTTAKITVQHGLIFDQLLRRFGRERGRLYLEANCWALEEYRRLCGRIDCGFSVRDSYVYTLDDRAALDRELAALELLGGRGELVSCLPLPFSTAGAVRIRDQAQFHPLRFLAALAGGLRICEHTPVRELRGMTAVTDRGEVRARRIVVATHFPLLNKHGSYFLKLYQDRSYVLELEGGEFPRDMYVDGSGRGFSLREAEGHLLLGGGSRRTGKREGGWRTLEELAHSAYPAAREVRRWAAQDCMSLDGVPYAGQYSANTPDLFVATGFNKWGMTSAMASARVLADLVMGWENPWAQVFSPSRSMLRPQLLVNGAEAALHLLQPAPRRCPHMGCGLKWNAEEGTWDCPCHGSRFTAEGRLLDGPATGDLPGRD